MIWGTVLTVIGILGLTILPSIFYTIVVMAIVNSSESEINKIVEFSPFSGSEDFAYYAAKFPACFFYIGSKPNGVEKAYFNHHPKWDIDEDALLVAAKAIAEVVCSKGIIGRYQKTSGM